MAAKPSSTKQSTNPAKSEIAVSYNEFKEHERQRYTGMKIGRSYQRRADARRATREPLWQTFDIDSRRTTRRAVGYLRRRKPLTMRGTYAHGA
jgi:hypothetical protein